MSDTFVPQDERAPMRPFPVYLLGSAGRAIESTIRESRAGLRLRSEQLPTSGCLTSAGAIVREAIETVADGEPDIDA